MLQRKSLEKTEAIFGIRAVIEAIRAGRDLDKVLVKRGLQGDLTNELLNTLRQFGIPFQFVPIEKINAISNKNHQGVIAFISQVTYCNIEEIIPQLFEEGKVPLILILDHITDVRNFGAIVRTAECAGVHAIIIPEKGAAQVNSDAVKTSAGALHIIPVCRVSSLRLVVQYLKQSGLQIVAATEKAAGFYNMADMAIPTCIIMGAEDTGVSNELIKASDMIVKIPIQGKIESLNVSVAAGIMLYEAVKQRMQ